MVLFITYKFIFKWRMTSWWRPTISLWLNCARARVCGGEGGGREGGERERDFVLYLESYLSRNLSSFCSQKKIYGNNYNIKVKTETSFICRINVEIE